MEFKYRIINNESPGSEHTEDQNRKTYGKIDISLNQLLSYLSQNDHESCIKVIDEILLFEYYPMIADITFNYLEEDLKELIGIEYTNRINTIRRLLKESIVHDSVETTKEICSKYLDIKLVITENIHDINIRLDSSESFLLQYFIKGNTTQHLEILKVLKEEYTKDNKKGVITAFIDSLKNKNIIQGRPDQDYFKYFASYLNVTYSKNRVSAKQQAYFDSLDIFKEKINKIFT